MNKLILITTLFLPIIAWAQPSSQVAWTVATINRVKSADPEKGKALAQSCLGCHGQNGISKIPKTPSLAGQSANYLFKQIRDFSLGDRVNPIMNVLTKDMTEDDAAAIAVWFSQLQANQQNANGEDLELAATLVKKGDSQRTLPPCEVCHGSDGQGKKIGIPALAGQRADYTTSSLKAYKSANRNNDVYSRMRTISELLSEEEIIQLGLYYQKMQ